MKSLKNNVVLITAISLQNPSQHHKVQSFWESDTRGALRRNRN